MSLFSEPAAHCFLLLTSTTLFFRSSISIKHLVTYIWNWNEFSKQKKEEGYLFCLNYTQIFIAWKLFLQLLTILGYCLSFIVNRYFLLFVIIEYFLHFCTLAIISSSYFPEQDNPSPLNHSRAWVNHFHLTAKINFF